MIIYSPQYINLSPQQYLEINTLYKPKTPKILINNLEPNKKIIILDHYLDKQGYLVMRVFNHQRSMQNPDFLVFSNNRNNFVLEKGKPLIEIFELEKD